MDILLAFRVSPRCKYLLIVVLDYSRSGKDDLPLHLLSRLFTEISVGNDARLLLLRRVSILHLRMMSRARRRLRRFEIAFEFCVLSVLMGLCTLSGRLLSGKSL